MSSGSDTDDDVTVEIEDDIDKEEDEIREEDIEDGSDENNEDTDEDDDEQGTEEIVALEDIQAEITTEDITVKDKDLTLPAENVDEDEDDDVEDMLFRLADQAERDRLSNIVIDLPFEAVPTDLEWCQAKPLSNTTSQTSGLIIAIISFIILCFAGFGLGYVIGA